MRKEPEKPLTVATVVSRSMRGAIFFVGTRPQNRSLVNRERIRWDASLRCLDPSLHPTVFRDAADTIDDYYLKHERASFCDRQKSRLSETAARMRRKANRLEQKKGSRFSRISLGKLANRLSRTKKSSLLP
jgi:hypothetical protein